jgi:hypothetical protein
MPMAGSRSKFALSDWPGLLPRSLSAMQREKVRRMLEFAVTMRAGRQDSLEPAADLLGYALTLNNEAAGEREQLDDKESHGEPAATQLEENAFDVVSCIGATWIGDGVPGTLRLMRPALRGRGLLLIGEPFWLSEPPPEAYCRPARAARRVYLLARHLRPIGSGRRRSGRNGLGRPGQLGPLRRCAVVDDRTMASREPRP